MPTLKLKYVLPLAQMTLGAALLCWSQVWGRNIFERIHGSFESPPPFQVLMSLNMPVALLRAFWFRHVPSPWEDLLCIPAIGLLWCWVALNMESWHEKRMVLTFRWAPLRVVEDLILIAVGGFIGVICIASIRSSVALIALQSPALLWCAALVLLFGRDLLLIAIGKSPSLE